MDKAPEEQFKLGLQAYLSANANLNAELTAKHVAKNQERLKNKQPLDPRLSVYIQPTFEDLINWATKSSEYKLKDNNVVS